MTEIVDPTIPVVKNLLLLDSEGKRIAVKYFTPDMTSVSAQANYEKNVFAKTSRTNARGEAEIIMFDDVVVVYKFLGDLMFYVTGDQDENEVVLYSVLQAFYESISLLLRGAVEKKTVLENLDLVLLAMDEVVDGGLILETDPSTVATRVTMRQDGDGSPLSVEAAANNPGLTLSQAFGTIKEQLYYFSPRTFLLPEMAEGFAAELAANKGRDKQTYIIKLDNGSQGRGIKLVQTPAQAAAALPTFEHGNLVACQYVRNPLLINGLKFDLRLYVLVRQAGMYGICWWRRCCAPLRVFLCREGLVRFCTEPYSPPSPTNLDHVYAHLTNYAVNKHNAAFQFNQDAAEAGAGSKWTLTAFAEWMAGQGHDFEALWGQIKQLVAKTLIATQPMLQYAYDSVRKPDDDGLTCFELLGFDVLIDDTLRPWLLEVNHAPSLTTDTPLDLAVKSRLIREALELAGVRPERVQAELAAKERAKQARLYNAHAASVAHGGSSTASSSGSTSAMAAQQKEVAGAPLSGPGSAAVGSQQAAVEGSGEPATPTASAAGLGPAVEPERGSAEWLAAQQAYEDSHLGQFEWVMPPPDPQLAAQYEELLAGALQIFYRSTMQGRNQQRLNEIRVLSSTTAGDHVLLRPADPSLPPYIAKLESLHEEAIGGAAGSGGGSTRKVAAVRWYARPAELELTHALDAEENEVFYTDDFALHDVAAADRAVLRSTLREEARKAVGDTGLLDHLLKHLVDQAATPAGEKLRRRHDAQGKMCYWLQAPADTQHDERVLRGEVQALSSELQEVKEARRVLSAVRGEAAQALQAVSAGTSARAATPRVQAAEELAQALLQRLQAAPPAAPSTSQEVAGAAPAAVAAAAASLQQLPVQLAALADVTRLLNSRCSALEQQVAALAAEGKQRADALAATLLGNAALRGEVSTLKHGMAALAAQQQQPPPPPPPPQQQQQQSPPSRVLAAVHQLLPDPLLNRLLMPHQAGSSVGSGSTSSGRVLPLFTTGGRGAVLLGICRDVERTQSGAMSDREGLQRAQAMKRQMQELLAGRAITGLYAASAALRTWALDRRAAVEAVPLAPALNSALRELVQLMADAAAGLVPPAAAGVPLTDSSMMVVSACCGLLGTLLMLCEAGLQLSEAEALRLLTAGALPLSLNLTASLGDSLTEESAALLGSCCSSVEALVELSSGPLLPPRAVTAARRTALRPQALAGWLDQAVAAFVRTDAPDSWEAVCDIMTAAQRACNVQGVPDLLQPPTQEALVGLAARAMAMEIEPEQQAADAPIMSASFGLPLQLSLGRLSHEQSSSCGLLCAASASLAARLVAAPARQARLSAAQRAVVGHSIEHMVLMHLVLVAAVLKDAGTEGAAGSPAELQLLQATVAALPLFFSSLHRLSDLVDSAALVAGAGSAGTGSGSAASGSSGRRGAEAAVAPSDCAACLAAQRLWHVERWQLCRSGGSAERAAEMQRRLDCILLTYLEALTARPAGMSPKDVVQPRMLALSDWCNWPPEVAGTDLFLADGCRGARMLMQTFADALADASCANQIVIRTVQLALRSQPRLLPVAAATPDLLCQLAPLAADCSRLGPPNPGIPAMAQPALISIVRSLLKWLQRCARDHQAAAASSSDGANGSSGSSSAAVAKLIGLEVDQAAMTELARLLSAFSRSPLPVEALPLPQPAASADELALRRARAMALRACANPRCTNLAGDSEGALKGRRCTGCRLVRFCSEACSKQDWQAHKRACRLLRQGTAGS
ncbi:zeta- subunit of COP-I complex [Chlorella sorokiniana]|uniref:Zeta-subunit of COP-I complex n=1 Tax=Chlorella sorokiniana TaxID=3076 RepID=A0A2P6TV20_CHLSO|nr:zeta- subunit of COP-I complex [Chlorella sorokiniana]|eukprot:PRW57894.1 zeta- subunit of COP-I complex [Chlorella sorokiniana]